MPLADNALTTADQLNISDTATAERIINAASSIVEGYCGRKFAKQEYTDLKRGNDRQILQLDNYPIISVSEVRYIDHDNPVDPSQYTVLNDEGHIFKFDKWDAKNLHYRDISSTQLSGTEDYNITVTYEAGYVLPKDDGNPDPGTLPYDLEQAVILLANHLYNSENTDLRMQRESIADLSKTYFQNQTNRLPSEITNILDRYVSLF